MSASTGPTGSAEGAATQGARATDGPNDARQRWMGLLARAPADRVTAYCNGLAGRPGYRRLRGPEQGLIMVRGRAGGTGKPFNMGEMTVTRCTVRLDSGVVGHGYVAGRNGAHAEASALCDALLQDAAHEAAVLRDLIEPLARSEAESRAKTRGKAAATKVDFFTMVRGGD